MVRTSDETRTSRRSRSAHRASSARSHAPSESSAACIHPTGGGERSVRLWMCRSGLEQLQTGRGDQPGVRGKRSSRSWWLPGTHNGRQPAPTRHAGHPMQRARDHTRENPSVAQVKNKAQQDQRPIVYVDEAGVALLPIVVRTSALHRQILMLRVTLTHNPLSAIGGDHPQRTALSTHARASVQGRGCRAFSPDAGAHHPWHIAHPVGWVASPSRGGDHTVSDEPDGHTRPSGARAWRRA